jgi:thymidylate kinase
MATILRACQDLFAVFDKRQIRYSHWKSNQHLTDGLCGLTDLDLLADKRQSKEVEYSLRLAGFKRVKTQKWSEYPEIEDWLGFDSESGKLIHVHLHYQLLMGKRYVKELHLPVEDILIDRSIRDSRHGLLINDPNLEMLLLIIRIGLKTRLTRLIINSKRKKVLPANMLAEFQYLRENLNEKDLRYFADLVFGKDSADKIVKIIEEGKYYRADRIYKIKKIINISLTKNFRFDRLTCWKLYYSRKLIRVIALVKKRLNFNSLTGKKFPKGGKIITVVGCDGSGKSSIVAELDRWLSWKNDVAHLYMGSGDGNVGIFTRLKKIKDLFIGKLKKKKSLKHRLLRNPNKLRAFLNYTVQTLFYFALARERYRKVLKGYQLRSNGKIVLTDRYPQNEFKGIYDGPHINSDGNHCFHFKHLQAAEQRIYKRIEQFPPDLVLKLKIPLEISRLRKPDENLDIIRRKIEITERLKFRNAGIVDIDAAKPLDEVLLQVKKAVWETL